MADRTLVGLGLKLEDVGGERQIGELDHGHLLADLRDAGASARQLTWLSLQPLTQFDRVLLARRDHDRRCEGMLLMQCQAAGDAPFLAIEAVTSAAGLRDEALLQRMLAYLMLRFDTFHARPIAILARTRHPALSRVMRDIAAGIDGAGFYPDPGPTVISLATASLAHRMARSAGPDRRFAGTQLGLQGAASWDGPVLATIDLRNVEEPVLIDVAVHLFRDRLPRSVRKQAAAAVAVPREIAISYVPAPIAAAALRATLVGPASRQ